MYVYVGTKIHNMSIKATHGAHYHMVQICNKNNSVLMHLHYMYQLYKFHNLECALNVTHTIIAPFHRKQN